MKPLTMLALALLALVAIVPMAEAADQYLCTAEGSGQFSCVFIGDKVPESTCVWKYTIVDSPGFSNPDDALGYLNQLYRTDPTVLPNGYVVMDDSAGIWRVCVTRYVPK